MLNTIPGPRRAYQIRPHDLVAVVLLAALAALIVFSRTPETVAIESADGRVRLEGQAPRDLGLFRLVKSEVATETGGTARVGAVYEAEPTDVLLPLPLRLSLRFDRVELDGTSPLDLVIARFDTRRDRWEPLLSSVDLLRETVVTEVRSLGRWALIRRETISTPSTVDAFVDAFLEIPVEVLGYTLDLEYARAGADFVLYAPAYRRGGCNGFFEGEEEHVVQESILLPPLTYRATLTLELGDTARCGRQLESPATGSDDAAAAPVLDPGEVPPREPWPEITWEVCDGLDNDRDGEVDEGFDRDGDGLKDCHDNCAHVWNPDQRDRDPDGVGDACDT